jgi:hypothetical protein
LYLRTFEMTLNNLIKINLKLTGKLNKYSHKNSIDMNLFKISNICFAIIFLSSSITLYARNVGVGTTDPHPSAMMDVVSTDKGMLIPRMDSSQRTAIDSPAQGLLVYDTDTHSFWYYQGSQWNDITAPSDRIQDEDGNTRVLVEKNPNEDIIRFELAGLERATLINNSNNHVRLEFHNSNENTFIGKNSGLSNTFSVGNVAFGAESLRSNWDGSFNVAIGTNSLHSNVGGNRNTAIGYNALYSNVAARSNTAIGFNAMWWINSTNTPVEAHNTAVGREALRGSTTIENNTGVNNSAFGSLSLLDNASGTNNTALGYRSMVRNLTGSSNTAIGFQAMHFNISGDNNTAIGLNSLRVNSSGVGNVAVGRDALTNTTTGNFNLGLGMDALFNNTTGSHNIGIGYRSNVANGNYTNAIAIGYEALVDCSNCMVLGGMGDNALNVGIGTTQPTERLHINGNLLVEGMIVQEAVIEPSLNAGYSNAGNQFETAGYYKSFDGRVYLQGTLVRNAGAPTAIFSMPPGYRPNKEVRFTVFINNNELAQIGVNIFGDVLNLGIPDGSTFSLDGISFRVD